IRMKVVVFLKSHYHMWFMVMIAGLYMCIPLIKSITKTEITTKYFLALAFCFTFFIPEVICLMNDFGYRFFPYLAERLNKFIENANIYMVMGYTGYFVLGYYLKNTEINKKGRILIYLFGLIGFVFTVSVSWLISTKSGVPVGNYYNSLFVNVMLEAVAVFVLFKYLPVTNSRINALFAKMSEYSFGAYLIHAFILEQSEKVFGINTLSFNPLFSVLLISIIVCVISYCISAVLHKIPVINKYLV
ncbi:MAG: acyltransferase family protein, partial [Erysipelotrichaceae bacterium]|nr:acyltransferase family protein [Erysipelotrichaceae bacterium]